MLNDQHKQFYQELSPNNSCSSTSDFFFIFESDYPTPINSPLNDSIKQETYNNNTILEQPIICSQDLSAQDFEEETSNIYKNFSKENEEIMYFNENEVQNGFGSQSTGASQSQEIILQDHMWPTVNFMDDLNTPQICTNPFSFSQSQESQLQFDYLDMLSPNSCDDVNEIKKEESDVLANENDFKGFGPVKNEESLQQIETNNTNVIQNTSTTINYAITPSTETPRRSSRQRVQPLKIQISRAPVDNVQKVLQTPEIEEEILDLERFDLVNYIDTSAKNVSNIFIFIFIDRFYFIQI